MDGVACSIRLFICFLCSNGRRDPFSSTFHQPSFLKRSQRPTLFYLSAALISQTVADTPSLLPFRTFLFSNGRRDPFSSTFQPLSLLKRSQTPTLFYLSAAFFPQTVVETPSLLPFSCFLFSNRRWDPLSSTFQPLSFLKPSQRPLLFYLSAAFFPQTVVETPSLLPFSRFLFSNRRRDPLSSTFQPLSFLKPS